MALTKSRMGRRMWEDGLGLKGAYMGQLNETDRPDGEGTLVTKRGDEYIGNFRNGTLICGKVITCGVETYNGEWEFGQHHGFGVCNYDCGGNVYEGQWRCDKMHGYGLQTCADGGPEMCGIWEKGELKTELPREEVDTFIRNDSIAVQEKQSTRAATNDVGLLSALQTSRYTKPKAMKEYYGPTPRHELAILQPTLAKSRERQPMVERQVQSPEPKLKNLGRTSSPPKMGELGYPTIAKKAEAPKSASSGSTLSTGSGGSTGSGPGDKDSDVTS